MEEHKELRWGLYYTFDKATKEKFSAQNHNKIFWISWVTSQSSWTLVQVSLFQQTKIHWLFIIDDWQSNHISDSEIIWKCLACLEWEKDKAINSNMKSLSIPRFFFMMLNIQFTRVIPKNREIIQFHLGKSR